MKIKSMYNSHLRNNEHFQFHTEFKDLVTTENAETLKIGEQFATYLICYKNEDVAFQKIMKSATTEEIEAADKARDSIFRGMVDTNKAALNHFNSEINAAARRLKIVFDTYGNVTRKTLNEETSAIYNLLQELTGNHAADTKKVGLNQWATQLDANNKALETLVRTRNSELAAKTELKMAETRESLDSIYNTIVERVNALIVIEGVATYESFAKKLNLFIEKYNNIVAQRRGIAKAQREKAEKQQETPEPITSQLETPAQENNEN